MKRTLLILALVSAIIFLPQNAKAQWVQTSGPTTGGAVQALAVNGNIIFAGTASGGVFRSSDSGISWTAVNSGLATTNISALAISGSNVFVATGSLVYLSTNNGASWTASGPPLPITVLSLLVNGTDLFAGLVEKWPPFLNPSDNIYGVYRSPDNGTNWIMANTGLPTYAVHMAGIWEYYTPDYHSLAVSGSAIFAAGGCPYRSIDNGASWIQANNGMPLNATVLSLAVSGSTIYSGLFGRNSDNYGGAYISTDTGTNWTADTAGIPQYVSVQCFAVIRSDSVVAGTQSRGVFLSCLGLPWIAWNSGLTDTNVICLAINNNYFFAGTGSSGVWRRSLSEVSVKKQEISLLEQFSFNLHTSIQSVYIAFSLPRSSPVKLNIYNLSGHLISTLCDRPMAAGTHRISWDTRGLAAGCYIVKLQAGTITQTKSVPLFR